MQEIENERTVYETYIKDIKENDSDNFCEVLLSNNKTLNAMVVAGCDGRNSNVAKIAKLNEIKQNYNQTAITLLQMQNLKIIIQLFKYFQIKEFLQLCLVLIKWTYAYNCMVG